jgi:hypothetical protein
VPEAVGLQLMSGGLVRKDTPRVSFWRPGKRREPQPVQKLQRETFVAARIRIQHHEPGW